MSGTGTGRATKADELRRQADELNKGYARNIAVDLFNKITKIAENAAANGGYTISFASAHLRDKNVVERLNLELGIAGFRTELDLTHDIVKVSW